VEGLNSARVGHGFESARRAQEMLPECATRIYEQAH
jgi:hypothetical protein